MSALEDQVAFLKTAVLSEKRAFLCQNITPKAHYPYLRSCYVLSEEDEELIEAQQVRKQKVHKLVDLLVTKGSRGFDEFIRSLIQERTQLFIVEELNRAFEDKQKRLKTLLASQEVAGDTEHVPVTKRVNGANPTDNQMSTHRISGTSVTRTSVSDLGVDTDSLPKPILPKRLSNSVKSVNDSFRQSGEIVYRRENSIEENEDKSVKSAGCDRSRTTSDCSSSNA